MVSRRKALTESSVYSVRQPMTLAALSSDPRAQRERLECAHARRSATASLIEMVLVERRSDRGSLAASSAWLRVEP